MRCRHSYYGVFRLVGDAGVVRLSASGVPSRQLMLDALTLLIIDQKQTVTAEIAQASNQYNPHPCVYQPRSTKQYHTLHEDPQPPHNNTLSRQLPDSTLLLCAVADLLVCCRRYCGMLRTVCTVSCLTAASCFSSRPSTLAGEWCRRRPVYCTLQHTQLESHRRRDLCNPEAGALLTLAVLRFLFYVFVRVPLAAIERSPR